MKQTQLTTGSFAAVGLSWMAGFAQFSTIVLLGEVAVAFSAGDSPIAGPMGVGLSATAVGVAFAVIRLSSLGGLAGGVAADRVGRRPTLLIAATSGLVLTAAAAWATSFMWWVVLVAAARPGLNATQLLVGVVVAEECSEDRRAWGMTGVAAGFALGAGAISLLHGAGVFSSFRPLLATIGLPLLLMPVVARRLREPAIYERSRRHALVMPRRLGRIPAALRRRLVAACLVTGALGMVTAPVFSHVFVYGEQVLGQPASLISGLVVAGGITGGLGLLAGRWAADRFGRIPAAVVSLPILGAAAATAFHGSFVALAIGYLAALSASAAFGPAWGAWQAEAFPTATRATAAGWTSVSGILGAVAGLLGFGVLTDLLGGFGTAILPFAVVAVGGALVASRLAETRGRRNRLDHDPEIDRPAADLQPVPPGSNGAVSDERHQNR